MVREDDADLVFRTENAKFEALIDEVVEMTEAGRPVLVGTTSVEKSEVLSEMLKRRGIKHEVLNAKFHEKEAPIVAQAGRIGRGDDRHEHGRPRHGHPARRQCAGHGLDGAASQGHQPGRGDARAVYDEALAKAKADVDRDHDKVVAAGGLHIIGTERHEARRIDNQLRGRAGRQGDPGSSRFYLSLEDIAHEALRLRPRSRPHGAHGPRGRHGNRVAARVAGPSRVPSRASRATTSTSASASSSTTTSSTSSARRSTPSATRCCATRT